MNDTMKEIRAEMRATRQEMKAKGVRRVSCFNGGLDADTYRLNARMFALETALTTAKATEGGTQ